ncbi:hypothetical protein EJ04DRAFT_19292 [Polyplosphaeria fusca]|uniref:Uncharacterized protein n=1 Tax=Polyplosphaeria fusca TaxID=682080 RepID=A0A9P4QUA5_9PLEO|nr:hypothetical protein EJ04DRAFT_19292 [Polyplosphaeria fusca]
MRSEVRLFPAHRYSAEHLRAKTHRCTIATYIDPSPTYVHLHALGNIPPTTSSFCIAIPSSFLILRVFCFARTFPSLPFAVVNMFIVRACVRACVHGINSHPRLTKHVYPRHLDLWGVMTQGGVGVGGGTNTDICFEIERRVD